MIFFLYFVIPLVINLKKIVVLYFKKMYTISITLRPQLFILM